MSETLLIRLASHAHQPMFWWLFSADDRLLFSGEVPDAATLANLQEYANGNQVIALVPACDVVLRSVNLPGRLTHKTRNALPFLLEDEVVEDPARLHVAVLAHESPSVHLAAVEHSLMQEWLRWLDEAGLQASRMLPDVLALPQTVGGYRWSLDKQHLIRESRWQGMVLEDELITCLPAARVSGWQTTTQTLPLRAVHLPPVTLLQGTYRPQRNKSGSFGVWRTPLYLLVASLVMVLATRGLESLSLSHQQSALQEQMTAVYRHAFPDSKPVSDPWFAFKKKMEERNSRFLPLARTLDSVLPSTVRVQTLQFDAAQKELQAQLSGTSAIALQAIEQRIPAGFSLRIAEENTRSGTVTVYLNRKPKRQKENHPAMSRLEQMKAQLAQMQSEIGQKTAISLPVTNMADVMTRTSTVAHLPSPPVTQNDNQLEIKYATPLPFTSLANWLQTLELQYGIVLQQVELTDKGQGNVQVESLLLSGRSRS